MLNNANIHDIQTLKNTEGAIKNGQSRENQQIFSKSSTLTIHHGFFHPPITILHKGNNKITPVFKYCYTDNRSL
jgi:hypothetical protein